MATQSLPIRRKDFENDRLKAEMRSHTCKVGSQGFRCQTIHAIANISVTLGPISVIKRVQFW
jgi:hypothetical protein